MRHDTSNRVWLSPFSTTISKRFAVQSLGGRSDLDPHLKPQSDRSVCTSSLVFAGYSEYRIIGSAPSRYKLRMDRDQGNPKKREDLESSDERSPERRGDLQARLDDLGSDPAQVGQDSAGQSVSSRGLSEIRDSNEESVEELSDADQAIEAASVEGSEDAADHPERPTHTHEEYDNPEDVPPRRRDDAA